MKAIFAVVALALFAVAFSAPTCTPAPVTVTTFIGSTTWRLVMNRLVADINTKCGLKIVSEYYGCGSATGIVAALETDSIDWGLTSRAISNDDKSAAGYKAVRLSTTSTQIGTSTTCVLKKSGASTIPSAFATVAAFCTYFSGSVAKALPTVGSGTLSRVRKPCSLTDSQISALPGATFWAEGDATILASKITANSATLGFMSLASYAAALPTYPLTIISVAGVGCNAPGYFMSSPLIAIINRRGEAAQIAVYQQLRATLAAIAPVKAAFGLATVDPLAPIIPISAYVAPTPAPARL
mmetsp:Transcript_45340/g.73859  ORF Transcript_45340/g.73859 Transcript_45340/m.73859 type:complete len:297 (+) Transcript_45340:252-1142(+)|eukprot:CAMPEP_0184651316 /NCGR_PEP_ID=MMETSP0308-20130426/8905_1 /TAXON_ID=38269 /ORGANISM="Gloeochaete witrockiana, Strain SAG 46.84" /LENGTH=296 /DNA_ID=CAMNT_0027085443 /DNA_START=189 /DNA_END=1079 /DNA_ORIENTATION=-